MEHAQALEMTRLVFPDQLHVPYVPSLFRVTNPPPEVRFVASHFAMFSAFACVLNLLALTYTFFRAMLKSLARLLCPSPTTQLA